MSPEVIRAKEDEAANIAAKKKREEKKRRFNALRSTYSSVYQLERPR